MECPSHIQDKLDELGILASDVEMKFVRGSGPGGQKINKTSSTVVLVHRPSGMEVRVQRERSQTANRETAWEILVDRLQAAKNQAVAERIQAQEKKRRASRPRSRNQKKRMVANKRHRGQTKALRNRVSGD